MPNREALEAARSGVKVVFLDIDGPMIPATCFLYDPMASLERRFPPTTVAVIRAVCERTGAKIVFNTTHNAPFEGIDNIDVALEKAGVDRAHFHADRHTSYPSIDRALAITKWVNEHPGTDWIAFDDVRFTDDPRLILVDSDIGLHIGHVNQAIERFGGEPVVVLL